MGLTRITSDGITDATIATADLADQSVTLAKLPHGTSSNDGKFLRANNGADPTFETVNTDLSADSSPQLGGDLQSNGHDIDFANNDKAVFGTSGNLEIYSTGSESLIHENATGNLKIKGSNLRLADSNDNLYAFMTSGGAVEMYHNGSKKFETQANGATLFGYLNVGSGTSNWGFLANDSTRIGLGTSQDLILQHDGTNSYLQNATGVLYLNNTGGTATNLIVKAASNIELQPASGETGVKAIANGGVELYHNNSKKLETSANGNTLFGTQQNLNGDVKFDNQTNSGMDLRWDESLNRLHFEQDNIKAVFGAGSDLEIFHDGTLNRFQSNGLKSFQFNPKDTDVGLKIIGDGGVELYYDNTKMAETISTGLKVSRSGGVDLLVGSTNAQGVTISLDGDSNGDGSGSDYATIEHDTTGNLHIRTDCPAHNCSMAFSTNGTLRHIIHANGHFYPYANNTYDLGMNNNRWRNVYTNDLHLSNEGGANDVDQTWGSFTIQEGEESLFLINKRNGKKYKFNLTEVS